MKCMSDEKAAHKGEEDKEDAGLKERTCPGKEDAWRAWSRENRGHSLNTRKSRSCGALRVFLPLGDFCGRGFVACLSSDWLPACASL